jgi:hypothetical protein
MTGTIEIMLILAAVIIWALIGSLMADVFRHSH